MTLSRRDFLAAGTGLAASALVPPRRAKRLASIHTVYTLRSHAYHIAGRFLHGYPLEGVLHRPEHRIVRMFNEQTPEGDLSRGLAATHGFEMSTSIAQALGGEKGLDVDAVLLIGEHGDYPQNELGQKLYPRHRLFMEIVAQFRKAGKSVPVFSDKHLSYDSKLAHEMVSMSRELGFGFMAGSSLPVTWRRPGLEPAIGTPITEGLVVCYGGPDIYGFHGLETLQVMMERRAARETGVKAIRGLRGPGVWKAGDDGLWSWELLEAALSRCPSRNIGSPKENVAEPVAFLLEYKDGARGTVLLLNEHVADFAFAGRIRGAKDPVSTLMDLPAPPGARYFSALCHNIEKLFTTGRSPYPVERTLLTSCVLEHALRSLHAGGARLESPLMEVDYAPPADSGFLRGRITDQ
jgi:hypothetical protein